MGLPGGNYQDIVDYFFGAEVQREIRVGSSVEDKFCYGKKQPPKFSWVKTVKVCIKSNAVQMVHLYLGTRGPTSLGQGSWQEGLFLGPEVCNLFCSHPISQKPV